MKQFFSTLTLSRDILLLVDALNLAPASVFGVLGEISYLPPFQQSKVLENLT